MGYVYVYAPNTDDLSTTGLCGALLPIECTHEEIAGGMSAVTLVHPFDSAGKWLSLKRGCILSCVTRVRTTPEIENGQVVTTVERWTVKASATQAQRTVYTKAINGKKKKALDPGTRVYVTQKGESRYKFLTETLQRIDGKKAKEPVGWIAHEALTYETTEVIPPGSDGIETVVPPWIVRAQLFRIQDVEIDTDAGTVSVYALHISYDLMTNITNYESLEPLTALEALNGIDDGCDFPHDFEFFTDIGDRRTSFEAVNISPIDALLNPDTGFLKRWGAELVRDDWALYFLHRAGRNRGTRIEYAKNLLGVNYSTSDENVVTAIKPTGVKKDGDLLYLTDDENSPANYILSPYAGDYPVIRAIVQACDDCTVEKGKKGVTLVVARARMVEQAERMFAEGKVDRPDVNLTVNFLQLGDTAEYRQYKDLEPVYLYDEVPVIDRRHGIEVMTDVHRVLWDCLEERVIEVEMGNVREGLASIYSWQVQALNCGKLIGSLPGEIIEDDSMPQNKLDPDLQEALKKAWADIERAQGMIDNANAWLDTLDAQLETITAAVGDNAGAIAALQIAADAIRAAVRSAEGNIAALEITANEIATALSDAEGNISTLQQTAAETSSTITNMQNDISSVRQTANSVSSTVSALNGQVASLITQVAEGVAVKLYDARVSANFEARIGSAAVTGSSAIGTAYGITLYYNGVYAGALLGHSAYGGATVLQGPEYVRVHSDSYAEVYGTAQTTIASGVASMDFIAANNQGRRIQASEAIYNASDKRLKTDIAPIEWGEELFDALKPKQYHMRAEDAPRMNYGFLADDVENALKDLGLPPTVLYQEPPTDEEYKGLVYQELHALTVHKVQCMEARHKARIEALEARLAALEHKEGAS